MSRSREAIARVLFGDAYVDALKNSGLSRKKGESISDWRRRLEAEATKILENKNTKEQKELK